MQPGEYNEYFELVHVTRGLDGYGEPADKEKTVYAGYAKVVNLSAREYWEAWSVHQENTLKFHTRWHPALDDIDTTEHWLKWRGRKLDIIAIDEIEHKGALCTIKAKEADR